MDRLICNREKSHLSIIVVVFFVLGVGYLSDSARGQEGCVVPPFISFTGGVQEYPIPPAATGRMTFTAKGGDGGYASIRQRSPFGDPYEVCGAPGGRGARITASFNIGSGSGELEPGGTLRFIVGGGGSIDVTMPIFLRVPPAAADGGSGTAILYRPPGVLGNDCSDWRILIVAGGGGGAHQNMGFSGCAQGEAGGDASLTTDGIDGGGSNGGDGGLGLFGAGGSCGTKGNTAVSGGGGGLSGPGGSCFLAGAAANCPNGGASGIPYGFGSGGRSNGNGSSKRGGGGGGGYSGGGGGGDGEAGGGGGSYVDTDALDVVMGHGTSGHGFVLWSAPDMLVNDECVNAIP